MHLLRRMTTIAATANPIPLVRPFRRCPLEAAPDASLWTISLRAVIHADAQRLCQAFTSAEYLETWIFFPGDDASARLVGWQEKEGYRLDHYSRGRRDAILRARFHVRRRRKLLFTWSVTGEMGPPESQVLVRMRGNFASTLLDLHHRGASSPADRVWQEAMWQASLHRLADLFHAARLPSSLT